MHIREKIERALAEGRDFWSFEYFPAKTETGAINLFDRLERMYSLGPEFIDFTWGAGGSTSDATLQAVVTSQSAIGLETCMHLTCTNMPKDKIDFALKACKEAGIQNILALRGDPPLGQDTWSKTEGGFAHAIDLVKYIREQYGTWFCIGVAGYPEGHIENPNKEADFAHFLEKATLADYCVTQLFYEPDLFINWMKRVRDAGCQIPILPGIMPIQSYAGFQRLIGREKTHVPRDVLEALEPIKDDDKAVKDFGVKLAIDICNKLRAAGQKGFHFYTMNLEKSVRLILEGLKFVAPLEVAKPLPWNPSLAHNRKHETVRPIFWRNRNRSYVLRTESWDEFPNGRWGDSRSPAYGDVDFRGAPLKFSPAIPSQAEEALKVWGEPVKVDDIHKLFVDFCRGNLVGLPWSDKLSVESSCIRDQLAGMNSKGFLTINSQPAVDGRMSIDATFGWGPKGGFVYQKAYVEFFVAPEALEALLNKMDLDTFVSYYAVNRKGDLRTNVVSSGPNAVTWGVFPGQEIVQPTIVERESFMAWKDEAFGLWKEWARVYPSKSASASLIEGIADNWFLVNVVHNHFKSGSAIFELFETSSIEE
ncbi:methylenetetrahydrofolate reductase-domain-containing protein [Chytriomyces sp. MP71]|nr:methylenetetrahydrofolate reductase-domain-containing protein [Chytriomyces sp. MP71]